MTHNDVYSASKTTKNAIHFLIGKGFSAACTAFLLGFIVRFLPLHEYGYYISTLATIETGFGLSSLGFEWVIIRYVPSFVVDGPHSALRRFIINAILLRFVLLFTYATTLALLTYYFKPQLFATFQPVIFIITALFIAEGLMRLLREFTLESLANQKLAQLGLFIRQGTFSLLLINAYFLNIQAKLETVLLTEFCASCLTLTLVVLFVSNTIKPLARRTPNKNWTFPSYFEIKNTALHNYFANIISYPYDIQTLTLLVATFETPIHTALFGFCAQIITIMRGYLPSLLLMNVIRPRLIGLYELSKQFDKPAREAKLISRLSFLTIFPIVISIFCYGDWLIKVASGGRFNEGGTVLLLLTLSLILNIQRLLASLLINCIKYSSILISNAIYALLTFPIFLLLMTTGHAIWYVAATIIWGDIVWCINTKRLLKLAGFKWLIDLPFILRLLVISIVCIIFLKVLHLPANMIGFLLSGLFISLFFLSYLYFFNPLGAQGSMLKAIIAERFRSNRQPGDS